MEGKENDRISKRFYGGVCAASRSVGRARKRWIDSVKECLRKRSLDVRQARIEVNVERLRESMWGIAQGIVGCHNCMKPYNLKDIKGKTSFLSFVSLLLLLTPWNDMCQLQGGGRS